MKKLLSLLMVILVLNSLNSCDSNTQCRIPLNLASPTSLRLAALQFSTDFTLPPREQLYIALRKKNSSETLIYNGCALPHLLNLQISDISEEFFWVSDNLNRLKKFKEDDQVEITISNCQTNDFIFETTATLDWVESIKDNIPYNYNYSVCMDPRVVDNPALPPIAFLGAKLKIQDNNFSGEDYACRQVIQPITQITLPFDPKQERIQLRLNNQIFVDECSEDGLNTKFEAIRTENRVDLYLKEYPITAYPTGNSLEVGAQIISCDLGLSYDFQMKVALTSSVCHREYSTLTLQSVDLP